VPEPLVVVEANTVLPVRAPQERLTRAWARGFAFAITEPRSDATGPEAVLAPTVVPAAAPVGGDPDAHALVSTSARHNSAAAGMTLLG